MIDAMQEGNTGNKQNCPTKSCLILRNIQTPIILHPHPPTTTHVTFEPNVIIKINRNVLKNLTIAVWLATDNPS